VVRLTADGERSYRRGDLAGAIERYQRACALVRDASDDDAEGAIPAARVIALAAGVRLSIGGDPDLAVAAAGDAEAAALDA
jgi:hypothetical protein